MKNTINTIKLLPAIFIISSLLLLQACSNDTGTNGNQNTQIEQNTDTPDGALLAIVQSLKSNDLKSLIKSSLSDDEYQKLIKQFEESKKAPSEADKAQFSQMMGMLTSDGAVDQLMAMAEPQLVQARTQLPMLLMSGKFMVASGIQSSTDIPDSQKESATKVANALMDFVGENDILSEEVTRKAITAAVATAKELDMQSLDEVQNMSFDTALDKASIAMGGVKNILGAYGISMNDILNSIDVSEVTQNGDSASMKVAYEFLGQALSQDVTMEMKNGKWVAKQ